MLSILKALVVGRRFGAIPRPFYWPPRSAGIGER